MEVMIHLAASLVAAAIRYSIKNPEKAEKVKEDLLAIRDAISEAYPDAETPTQ